MSSLETTVTELLQSCRDALAAIAPVVERVGMRWKEPDVYDDWDAIAEVLFQQVVVESLRWALPDDHRAHFALPQYAMKHESVAATSYIRVVEAQNDRHLAFHGFGTHVDPFDIVRTQQVTEEGVSGGTGFVDLPVSSVKFVLCLRDAHETRQVDRVAVAL